MWEMKERSSSLNTQMNASAEKRLLWKCVAFQSADNLRNSSNKKKAVIEEIILQGSMKYLRGADILV